jgi:catechol 2,3-dioxygenase-like lactoylglutathione lyase family enzyme
MQLVAVRIWVKELVAARDFYGSVLGLKARWDHGFAVGYDVGQTLIVEQDDGSEPEQQFVGRFVGASLRVDDIAATHRELCAKGVVFEAPPDVMSWGGILAHFRDPDGNVLTLLGD